MDFQTVLYVYFLHFYAKVILLILNRLTYFFLFLFSFLFLMVVMAIVCSYVNMAK